MTTDPKPIKAVRLGTGGAFIAPVFLLLAGWFLYGAAPVEIPKAATPKLNKAHLDARPGLFTNNDCVKVSD